MRKVLFISLWYPHRNDPMAGLFVQKHAEAVSLYCEVKVLFVIGDENIHSFELVEKNRLNLSELIVYYPVSHCKTGSKISKAINYLRAYWKGYKQLSKQNFSPDIVHASILTRTGFIAWLFKLWTGTPYIISEHWSRYLSESNSFHGNIRKFVTRIVVRNAEAVLPVSLKLKDAMLAHNLKNRNYYIIYNVVDDCFFNEYPVQLRTKKRLIHVSCFDEKAKNIKGIIHAAFKLSLIRQDFELLLIGNGIDFENVRECANSLHFPEGMIRFLGEKTSEEVAMWMQNSDFFILFSNYETAGVVISESLVCGLPVLTTKVGIAPECINDKNGILISMKDENGLFNGMSILLDHSEDFDSTEIKNESKNKFSYSTIGAGLSKIYEDSLLFKKK
jgi:glycosyltransferase involved in cell wall biosynthesis